MDEFAGRKLFTTFFYLLCAVWFILSIERLITAVERTTICLMEISDNINNINNSMREIDTWFMWHNIERKLQNEKRFQK